MKQQLPSRPNLDQLKNQAKDLFKLWKSGNIEALQRIKENHPRFIGKPDAKILGAEFSLSDAQFVIAREYGFDSWPKLKIHVEALARGNDPQIYAFLFAACSGNQVEAKRLLAEQPALACANIYTATMLGESDIVRAMLLQEPSLATRRAGPKNWDPLLFASASRFHRESETYATGILDVARQLLANGADPNTFYLWEGDGKSKQSALYLATSVANNPALARVLLEAGADPNDNESIYHAAENHHLECLELLAEFGVNVNHRIQRWNNTPLYFILGHKPSSNAAKQVFEGVRWLLEHGADPNVSSYDIEGRPIHMAASNGWGTEMLELLLKHGADLHARRKDGKAAYSLAAQRGHAHVMEWLRQHGAEADLTPSEQFFAACGRGDEPEMRAMLMSHPDLIRSLSEDERRLIAEAAIDGKAEAVRLMLQAGIPVDGHGDDGMTPLHGAAWWGYIEVINLLLAHHPPLDGKDKTYDATPLGWATHGSVNCRNPQGNYPAVVEALLQAGAKLEEPSGTEEVKAVMRRYAAKDPDGFDLCFQ